MTVRFDLLSVIILIVDLKIFSSVLFPKQLLIQHFAISRILILRIHAILQANQKQNWKQLWPNQLRFSMPEGVYTYQSWVLIHAPVSI